MNEVVNKNLSLSAAVSDLVSHHLKSFGKNSVNLHQIILEQIEPPLLQVIMENYRYNQSHTAKALGISRGTCRKLLVKYFDDKYCGRKNV